ncbi:MAG: TIGR02391 family protein [Chloroflexi bacterium]|nr:TIGR02391 family protein [Chloroflexota bacterium]
MLDWFFAISSLVRELRRKATDALAQIEAKDKGAAELVNGYMKTDYQSLYRLWEGQGFDPAELGNLGRHIHFGDEHDYHDILERDLVSVEENAEKHVREALPINTQVGIEELLHPFIHEHAFQHYLNGNYREAVLNSIVAVFDLIRERTGLDLDGEKLVGRAFSLDRARLILSELDTESGRNDQKGFIQIFSGTYLGIRNPKAHSLVHDLDKIKAAQYLIFASLLARRVAEAKPHEGEGTQADTTEA